MGELLIDYRDECLVKELTAHGASVVTFSEELLLAPHAEEVTTRGSDRLSAEAQTDRAFEVGFFCLLFNSVVHRSRRLLSSLYWGLWTKFLSGLAASSRAASIACLRFRCCKVVSWSVLTSTSLMQRNSSVQGGSIASNTALNHVKFID